VIIGVIGIAFGLLGPCWLPWVSWTWPTTLFSVISMVCIGLTYEIHSRFLHTFRHAWLFHPLMSLAFLYVYLGSAISATVRGGIRWRDRFVSLAQLRDSSVRNPGRAR